VNEAVHPLRADDPAPSYPSADAGPTTYGPGAAAAYSGEPATGTVEPFPGAPAGAAVEPSRPFWKTRRFMLLGLLVLFAVVAVGLAYRAMQPSATAQQKPEAPLVSVLVPGKAPVATRVNFTGAIAARYDMPIGVEGEGGRIAAVYVEAGDKVRRGQVLARLDTSVIASQVASQKAQLEQARAESALAKADYERADRIAKSVGALSQEEVDRRRSQVATTAARVEAAAAQLAEMQARLGRSEIRAPADGVVLTRTAEVGQTATPGGPALFRLGRGGEVEMRAQVAEQDLPKLQIGQPAEVRVTGVADVFPGKVRLLGAIIDPQTRLGEVRVALEPHPDLRPGAFARGTVLLGREPRPIVPQTAVLSDGTQNYVLVVGQGDKVERRNVAVAGTNAEGVIIASGLQGDERVVTTAGAFLREGEVVRTSVEKPTAPAGANAQG
jgi:RND family efflux transporter MFP subunit